MTDCEVLQILSNTRNKKVIIDNNIELQEYLKNRYDDIPETLFSYKEVYWRITHNIDVRPVCWCGKHVQFVGSDYSDKIGKTCNGYRKTCCNKHKYTQESVDKANQTKHMLYGESLQKISEKRKNTCLEKYGVNNVFYLDSVKQKIKDTNNTRYGCDYALQNDDIKQKVIDTNNKRYGCDNVFQNEIVKNKIKNSCLEKYGADNFMKSKEGRSHMSTVMSSSAVIEKRKETCLEKYGVDNVLLVTDIQEKRCQTLKRNGTSKISKEEMYLYE